MSTQYNVQNNTGYTLYDWSPEKRGQFAKAIAHKWQDVAAYCNIEARDVTDEVPMCAPAIICSRKLIDILTTNEYPLNKLLTNVRSAGLNRVATDFLYIYTE